jgi:hypothetical protein
VIVASSDAVMFPIPFFLEANLGITQSRDERRFKGRLLISSGTTNPGRFRISVVPANVALCFETSFGDFLGPNIHSSDIVPTCLLPSRPTS